MLEASSLMINSWIRAGASAKHTWVRRLFDHASGADLGFARWNGAAGSFWSWFGRREIQLFETEDASLVLSLRRGFWRVWEVFDAEERHVGSVFRNGLTQTGGDQLAAIVKPRGAEPGILRDRNHAVLARFERRDAGAWLFAFGPAAVNPFVRMVLLATILAWPPEPGG